ncbi:amino acid adenylation domain-containing protein [Brevibacillus laterosporus]
MRGEQLSYRELNEKANRLARSLVAQGVQADGLVGIMAERSLDMVVGMLAILKAGGAYVPIDPEYPEERIAYMLEDSNVNLLLLQSHLLGRVAFDKKVILLDDEQSYQTDHSNLELRSGPRHLAYVIYTSGTTGKPKGTLIEHKNVVRLLFNSKNLFDFSNSDTWTLFHSFCFDFSVWEMYGALLYGGKLVIVPPLTAKSPKQFLQLLQDQQVTILNQTPTYFYQLLQEEANDNRKELTIRNVIFGGEALSPALLKDWKAKYPQIKLINMYGITETTVHVTYKEITEAEISQAKSNIGKTIPTLSAYILDEHLRLQPVGVKGELYIAGEGLARGYLNRPELTNDRFVSNPFVPGERMYKTGDLARWLADGNIEYLGRIDHQVKIRGYRIELGEVETQLLNIESVQEAIVIAHEDQSGEKYLCSYFVADSELTVSELRRALSQQLPDYMIPAYFVQLERMPLTANGKLDRKALPTPEESLKTGREYVAPRTQVEEKLAQIWQEVLGLSQVGITENFFEIGGHSLRATTLVAKIHQVLDTSITLRDVFQIPTIEQMADRIANTEKHAYISIPLAEEKDYYPVSSAQKRLYILSHVEGGELSYNMPGVMTIEGQLDWMKLETAFRQLINRHETLRTGFEMVDGEVVQRISKDVEFTVEKIQAREEEVDAHINGFVRKFDLQHAPLIRVGLIEIEPDRHILLYDMHHIISDGVSMNILMQEVTELYEGKELSPLRLQYKDYAVWQQQRAKSELYEQQENYWFGEFFGPLPVLDLMIAYPRPAVRSFEGAEYEFVIDRALADQVNQLAENSGSTLYMLLMATYTILLSKYSGQEDIIVGTPVAGRLSAELEPLIGMFVNTLAIRNYPQKDKTFHGYLEEVKERTLQAFENQEYPLEELVEKLNVKRDASRNPLFDTMFVMQNTEDQEATIGSLSVTPYVQDHTVAKFDLTLSISTEEGEIRGAFEYCTKLFNKNMIEQLANDFVRILSEVISTPDKKLGEFDLVENSASNHDLVESIQFDF